jgi:hypothetical protein
MSSVQLLELNNDNVYQTICQNGHKSYVVLQNEKYEILYFSGIMAYLNGYYREAMTSLTAAQQRFHEFMLYAWLFKKNINQECFADTWNLVKNNRERQYGAFCLLYLENMNATPPCLPATQIRLYQRVLQEGYAPNQDETIAYARAVFDYVNETLEKAAPQFGHAYYMEDICIQRMRDAINAFPAGQLTSRSSSTIYVPAMIRSAFQPVNEATGNFDLQFENIKNYNRICTG